MAHSHFWQSICCSGSQKFPMFLHNSPLLALSWHMNLTNSLTSCLFSINFNIILFHYTYPNWSPTLRIFSEYTARIFICILHAACQAHPILRNFVTLKICHKLQYPHYKFFHVSCYTFPHILCNWTLIINVMVRFQIQLAQLWKCHLLHIQQSHLFIYLCSSVYFIHPLQTCPMCSITSHAVRCSVVICHFTCA